ncbi:hypothetical protein J4G37_00235 [Microvirga sp. 3-52]|nr:hypothetical protein [Microvirga sp. 3-52]
MRTSRPQRMHVSREAAPVKARLPGERGRTESGSQAPMLLYNWRIFVGFASTLTLHHSGKAAGATGSSLVNFAPECRVVRVPKDHVNAARRARS